MEEMPEFDFSEEVDSDNSGVWDLLTEEQKKYFKKITEKNEENLRYIG